jgi:hypothetical protein
VSSEEAISEAASSTRLVEAEAAEASKWGVDVRQPPASQRRSDSAKTFSHQPLALERAGIERLGNKFQAPMDDRPLGSDVQVVWAGDREHRTSNIEH